jgi:hypothetical protein
MERKTWQHFVREVIGTGTLRVDFSSKANQSTQNLLSKILINRYKYAINDNQMLTEFLQAPKKASP